MRGEPAGARTVAHLLREACRRTPETEAIVSPARFVRWTYAELDLRADRIAAACLAQGLRPGDRAVVWATNLPDWVALQFGLARAGVVLVTANTGFRPREIGHVLAKSRARALFFGRGTKDVDFAGTVASLDAAAFPELELRVGLDGATAGGAVPLEAFLAAGDDVPPEVVRAREETLDPADLINMQYTSGTTGFPKGVMLSHRNIVENAAAIGSVLSAGPADRLCLCVPLFHCFGCVIGTLVAVLARATIVLHDVFSPDDTLDAIEAERCTLVYGVPTMFLAELEAQRARPRNLTSLRAGVMAGAICPPALVKAVRSELHLEGILVAYGLTEASPGVTISSPEESIERRAQTVGRALPGVEVRIVDPGSGRPVARGERGELWCRGPNVMLGYDGEPDATAAAVTKDGWLRSGDLAEEDEDGAFRIVGRIKDIIIRGGENLSPAEIEDALREHPDVLDAAVFGIPSERLGEEVAAAVRRREGARVGEEELKAHVAARLSRPKVPSRIVFVEAFPLTGSGKVKRYALREQLERSDERGRGSPEWTSSEA